MAFLNTQSNKVINNVSNFLAKKPVNALLSTVAPKTALAANVINSAYRASTQPKQNTGSTNMSTQSSVVPKRGGTSTQTPTMSASYTGSTPLLPRTGTNTGLIGSPIAPTNTRPQVGNQMQNAQNLLNTGQQTDWERAAAENLANAKGMENFGQFAPNAEAPFYAGADQKKMESLITRPDLVGRAPAQESLYNKFANLYGTQANVGLQAAQTAAGRALEASQGVLTAGQPQALPYSSNAINPLTMQSYGAGGAGQGGAFAGGQATGSYAQGQKSAELHTSYGSAKSVGDNLKNLITSANINPTNPQFLNSINQYLQTGVASNPQYQQFYGTVNDYIASLAPILGVGGSPTDQKTSMAAQMVNQLASGKSINDTIDYFDALAADKVNAFDQSASGNFNTIGGGGTSGGGFAETW